MHRNVKIVFAHLVIVSGMVLYAWLIKCPINRIFGVICPFCGMTRAHIAALKMDLFAAVEYNSLFFLGVPLIIACVHLKRISAKWKLAVVMFIITASLALAVRYVLLLCGVILS